MDKKQAEDYIYQSYVRAAGYQDYYARDAKASADIAKEVLG